MSTFNKISKLNDENETSTNYNKSSINVESSFIDDLGKVVTENHNVSQQVVVGCERKEKMVNEMKSRFLCQYAAGDQDAMHSSSKFQTPSMVYADNFEIQLKRFLKKNEISKENRPKVPAIVFDIDGVFKMGGRYASFGAVALKKVIEAKVPYVLMTNGGGGRTEAQYANEINKKLNMFDEEHKGGEAYVGEDQMILSYSPFNSDLAHLKNEAVLIVGCPRVKEAAKYYGFKKAMHLSSYTRKHPTMNPFGKGGCEKDDHVLNHGQKETWSENFKAILVFTDPGNFFEGIQVLTDVLLSSRPGEVEYEKNHRIPIVFSNPDLLWKTEYSHPRFGQGAFRLALEACYKARMQSLGLSENEINARLGDFVQYGKPEPAQFRHTKKTAMKQAAELGCEISHFYMIGDNPKSDIQGAINMDSIAKSEKSQRWSGLLLRTGVYKDGDDTMGAKKVFDNVLNSVDHILEAHKAEIEVHQEQCLLSSALADLKVTPKLLCKRTTQETK